MVEDMPTRRLLVPGPLLELAGTLESEIQRRREWTPNDPALPMFERLLDRLHEATQQAAQEKILVTTEEAAEILDVSQERVRQLCRDGTLECVPGVRPYRIHMDSIIQRKRRN